MSDVRRSALALLLGCLLLVAGASALDGYDYYQTIEYAACDQETYQQDIVIHRTTGTAYNETAGGLEVWHIYVGDHCREDYGDVRFTNSTGAELAYYLWPDYDSSSARFCVRLEGADAAGEVTIWYGAPSAATTSDGNNVFLLFDNFDGESLDTSIWTNNGNSGGVTIENGEAIIWASASSGGVHNRYITSANPLSDSISVSIRAKYQTAGRYGLNIAVGKSARDHYGSPSIGASYFECRKPSISRGWHQDSTNLGGSVDVTNYNEYRFDIYDSKADYWLNGNQIFSNRPISFSTFPYVELYVSTWDSGNTVRLYVDYVLVRAYSATPPAALTFNGEQETAAPPVTAFTATPLAGLAPLTVQFTDLSIGGPTSWLWTFGDGNTSTAQNPQHTYTTAGTHTVTLTASHPYDSDTETKTAYITVAVLQPFPGLTLIPRDLTGNGLYTDINGNNRLDYNDLTVFFQHLAWAKTAQPIACFDFNGNGWLDYNDVITLFSIIMEEHP
ncbi:MAG: DUF2341 domain-containing protein [Methanomicrobiales archaeon]|nr:DUF2341 domain-containing protein [Methanomicrobiales archaeon]